MDKNGVFIGYAMAEAWEAGYQSATLAALCEEILKSGRKIKDTKTEVSVPEDAELNPA